MTVWFTELFVKEVVLERVDGLARGIMHGPEFSPDETREELQESR